MNSEFIIFSDMHYYKNTQRSIPDIKYLSSWIKSQIEITEQIFSYARDNSIETVIYNGDLFEEKNRIDQSLYNLVWATYKDYYNQGFRIIFNSGNHDILTFSRQSSLKPFSQIVDVIQSPATFYNDTEFRFIPHDMLNGNLEIDKHYSFHVLFTHADIADLNYGSIGVKSLSMIKPDIFKDWSVVFNGHVHRPQTHKNIVNIGSPMIQDFGEEGEEKRFIHYKDKTWKSIVLNCPKFITLPGLSPKIKKVIDKNDRDFFRVNISVEELIDPIFKKYNVVPHIIKSKKREVRLVDSDSDTDDIKNYLEIVDCIHFDKERLEVIGKELINEII